VVGVGEAVPDQHRADSLNTGWVKVPVKFPALAVGGSERGLGAPKQPFFPEIAAYGSYPSFCHSVNSANWSAVPIRPVRWHGRRIAFVRRKCSKHFVSIVRIPTCRCNPPTLPVPRDVRNIDIVKQWSDITREKRPGAYVLLLGTLDGVLSVSTWSAQFSPL